MYYTHLSRLNPFSMPIVLKCPSTLLYGHFGFMNEHCERDPDTETILTKKRTEIITLKENKEKHMIDTLSPVASLFPISGSGFLG